MTKNQLQPGQIIKLKAINGILFALLVLYCFFVIWAVYTSDVKFFAYLLFAIFSGAVLWINKGRRIAFTILAVALLLFFLITWLAGMVTSQSINTALVNFVFISVNILFFQVAENGKSKRTKVIKPFVIVFNIVAAVFLWWPGVLYTAFSLLFAYILYQCYDPAFYAAFFSKNLRKVIIQAEAAAGCEKFRQFGHVKLLTDEYQKEGVKAGDIGYIFELYKYDCKAYFTDKGGKTTAAVLIPYDDLQAVK